MIRLKKINTSINTLLKYEVITDKTMTVKEFCEELIKTYPDRWGSILVTHASMYQWCTNYSQGKINIPILKELENDTILSSTLIATESSIAWDNRLDFTVEILRDL